MKIGVDGDAITLDGEIASYEDAKRATLMIFGFADVLWPDESAAHEAEIEAERAEEKAAEASAKPKGARAAGAIRDIKPGSLAEKIKPLWDEGMRDVAQIAARIGATTRGVGVVIGMMRKGGLIE